MPFQQGHALLIGVGTYRDEPRLNVPISARDAEAVAKVLRDPTLCGYPEDQVKTLHDATASRDGVLSALDELAAQTGEDDTVFLFFCGHGDFGDDGDYYLTTHETRVEKGKIVSGSGVRQSELIAKLRALKAQRILIVINACHSGELSPTLGAEDEAYTGAPLPSATAAALLATGEGRIIMTACREDQKSYIGHGELSLFSQALVDGLGGKGTSSTRGFLSAFDLYTYLYFTIEEKVRQRYGLAQEPELTVLKGVGPFAVALYRGSTSLGAFDETATPPEGTAVREVSPEYARAMSAKLVGAGGVMIDGDNSGAINTGTQIGGDQVQGDKVQGDKIGSQTNTGGGAFFGGPVSAGHDVVGRDQTLVAGTSPGDLESVLAPLLAVVARKAPPDKRAEAMQQAQQLQDEAAKGDEADDGRLATLVNGLVALVPEAAKAVVSAFSSPILSGIAGPVTKIVLDNLKGR